MELELTGLIKIMIFVLDFKNMIYLNHIYLVKSHFFSQSIKSFKTLIVLCSYKILNSHDIYIYKDTFIQALQHIHKINHFIIPDKEHFDFLFSSLYVDTTGACQLFPFLGDFQVLNELVRMWKILSQPQHWMKWHSTIDLQV